MNPLNKLKYSHYDWSNTKAKLKSFAKVSIPMGIAAAAVFFGIKYGPMLFPTNQNTPTQVITTAEPTATAQNPTNPIIITTPQNTAKPTHKPTNSPSPTAQPTSQPTAQPTSQPTATPPIYGGIEEQDPPIDPPADPQTPTSGSQSPSTSEPVQETVEDPNDPKVSLIPVPGAEGVVEEQGQN